VYKVYYKSINITVYTLYIIIQKCTQTFCVVKTSEPRGENIYIIYLYKGWNRA